MTHSQTRFECRLPDRISQPLRLLLGLVVLLWPAGMTSPVWSAEPAAEVSEGQSWINTEQWEKLPESLRRIPTDREELARQLAETRSIRAQVQAQLEDRRSLIREIERDFSQARERDAAGALSREIGDLLRLQRNNLPPERMIQARLRDARLLISDLSVQRIDVLHDIDQMSVLESQTRQALWDVDFAELAITEAEANALLDRLQSGRREKLAVLRQEVTDTLTMAKEIEEVEQRLLAVTTEFRTFIDERVLWIRSAPPLSLLVFEQLTEAVIFLSRPDPWIAVVQDIAEDMGRYPGNWVILLLPAGALLVSRFWAGRKLLELGEMSAAARGQSYLLPLQVIGLTGLRALGYAAVPFLVGYRLADIELGSQLTRPLGMSLMVFGIMQATLRFFLEAAREKGLGHYHFGWSKAAREVVRANLLWLLWTMAPAVSVATFLFGIDIDAYRHSLGRLAAMVVMGALSVFAWRLFRPEGAIMAGLKRDAPNGALVRTQWLWFPLMLLIPWLVIVFSAFGYSYTAAQIGGRLLQTIWLLLAVFLLYATVMRWLQITQWKLMITEMKRKREEAERQQSEEAAQQAADGEVPVVNIEVPQIDAASVTEQSRTVVRTLVGAALILLLWWVWSGMFPALAFVANIRLWTYTGMANGDAVVLPITLANLIWAVALVVIALVFARNVPGILEIAGSKAGLTPGGRYALSTVCRYIITGIGFVLAFNALGVGWNNVQWLAAAFSLGVGFGLQEIVANFVSGLILLIERPIRVGDTVTVGDSIGTVTKIRIRATTIMTWDRHEVVVPNKEFITGRVTNWTLSDQVGRIVIPVGIAYGSNVELAEELLIKVAKAHPRTLTEPGPIALFRSFGDNSLDLELRVYVDGMDGRIIVTDELLRAINHEFNKAGITIAFPQRDLHLDTLKPLEFRMVRDGRGEEKSTASDEPQDHGRDG